MCTCEAVDRSLTPVRYNFKRRLYLGQMSNIPPKNLRKEQDTTNFSFCPGYHLRSTSFSIIAVIDHDFYDRKPPSQLELPHFSRDDSVALPQLSLSPLLETPRRRVGNASPAHKKTTSHSFHPSWNVGLACDSLVMSCHVTSCDSQVKVVTVTMF
jgi:hypothetical protein